MQQESWVYGSLAQKRRAKDDSGGRLHPAWGHPGPTPCPQSPVAETRAKSSQLWHTWWCGLFLPTVPSACQVCQPLNPRPREGPCLACPFGLPNCSPCTHSSFMQIRKGHPFLVAQFSALTQNQTCTNSVAASPHLQAVPST